MSTGSIAVAEVVLGAFLGLGVWFAGRWVLRVLDGLLWTVNGGHRGHQPFVVEADWLTKDTRALIDHNRQMRDTSDHKM